MAVNKKLLAEKSNEELEDKKNTESANTHPNYKKAAELIYISAFLGIGNLIWKYDTLDSGLKIFIAIIVVAFSFAIAYITSKGLDWFKYILLVLFGIGLIGIPFIIGDIVNNPVIGIINIVQTILQVWVLVLLFKISKP
ncbi:hypothetical protein [Chryseobacterium sp. GP-SGM7]|uniref:hypothetical protein n=1 Tax=Chryseobacterium sp. GP-SGM7 TaxID=3411323 RepID=UPI003B927D48